jgi:hypothetical protein
MDILTEVEQVLMLNSLNSHFHEVTAKLSKPKNLGYIEKKLLETTKQQLLELILKYEKLINY